MIFSALIRPALVVVSVVGGAVVASELVPVFRQGAQKAIKLFGKKKTQQEEAPHVRRAA